MSLWRIDAVYEADDDGPDDPGCVTLFARTALQLAVATSMLEGWYVDAYEEHSPMSDREADALVNGIWPTLRTDKILALAASPKAQARRQLETITARRGA